MDEPGPTIGALLKALQRRLAEAGLPEGQARTLLAGALGLTPAALYARDGQHVAPHEVLLLDRQMERLLAGESVHRIFGRRAFYAHEFELSGDTLEPRPDTEALVDLAIRVLGARIGRGCPFRFADIGTGTGAIAISILAEFPLARAVAVDIAPGALVMARKNALLAGVDTRLELIAADYLEGLAGPFDAIISNPPYIPTGVIAALAPTVRLYDPLTALDGGADGLDAYRALAAGSAACLAPDGDMLLEIGAGQGGDVRRIMAEAGLAFRDAAHDLGGHERALWFAAGSRATSL